MWNYIYVHSHNFYFEKCFFLIQWFIFKLSFIYRILCKLFSLCESSLQIFPIICHMSLSPFDWLIYWLHNYWDDYRRRHWRIWFIFIKQGKIILQWPPCQLQPGLTGAILTLCCLVADWSQIICASSGLAQGKRSLVRWRCCNQSDM